MCRPSHTPPPPQVCSVYLGADQHIDHSENRNIPPLLGYMTYYSQ